MHPPPSPVVSRPAPSARYRFLWWASAILAAVLAGCTAGCTGDSTGPQTRREIVVFGHLFVGEAVSVENAIHVSEVRPIDEYFDPEEAGVTEARVTLQRRGSEPDTLALVRPGCYANPAVVIEPRTTYDLRILIPGRDPISASTTTPWAFETHREPRVLPETMRLEAIPDSFTIAVTCPDPEQTFLVDVYCEEYWPDARYVDPAGSHDRPSDYEEYGNDNGEPRRIFAYVRMKSMESEGADRVVNFYDGMMVFYGRYTVSCLTIDDNYYRYLYRDHPEENGGIAGGIGVFGSACRKRFRVRVTP